MYNSAGKSVNGLLSSKQLWVKIVYCCLSFRVGTRICSHSGSPSLACTLGREKQRESRHPHRSPLGSQARVPWEAEAEGFACTAQPGTLMARRRTCLNLQGGGRDALDTFLAGLFLGK